MKTIITALSLALLGTATPSLAAEYTFNTTGNALPTNNTFTDTTPAPGLQMKVSAWQTKQSNDSISAATLAIYGGGLGVVGTGESTSDNTHQIDNAGGYTDFLLLQFSRAVTLSKITFNSYSLGSQTLDADLGWSNAGAITTDAWNSTVNLANGYKYDSGKWSYVANTDGATFGSDSFTGTAATGASTKWLIGAAGLPSYYSTAARSGALYDGLKLASVTVNEAPAVPEPAAWAMMITGFGMAGGALRRRRAANRVAIA